MRSAKIHLHGRWVGVVKRDRAVLKLFDGQATSEELEEEVKQINVFIVTGFSQTTFGSGYAGACESYPRSSPSFLYAIRINCRRAGNRIQKRKYKLHKCIFVGAHITPDSRRNRLRNNR